MWRIRPCLRNGSIYPRTRGAWRLFFDYHNTASDLSPRIRDAGSAGRGGEPERRSITACAGRGSVQHQTPSLGVIYPRPCGDWARCAASVA